MSTTTTIITIVFGVILFGIATWFAIRFVKKIKKKNAQPPIPPEILNDFQELEKLIKESNGKETAEQILWNYCKDRQHRKEVNDKNGIKANNETFNESGEGSNRTGTNAANTGTDSPRVAGATSSGSTKDGSLFGDRDSGRGKSIQVQSDTGTSKDKRKPKINWDNTD